MREEGLPFTERLLFALLGFGALTFSFLALLIFNDLLSLGDKYLDGSLEVLFVFGLSGAPILVWHIFDLVDPRPRGPNLLGRLVSYPLIVSVAIFSLAILIAMLLGVGHYNSCDGLDGAYFHSCRVGTSFWILIPFAAGFGLAWMLAVLKALVAVWSVVSAAPSSELGKP